MRRERLELFRARGAWCGFPAGRSTRALGNMRNVLLSLCLLLIAGPGAAELWSGPTEDRWSATNRDGFCSLTHPVGTTADKVVFTFALLSREDDRPRTLTFHVTPMQCELAWPVRVALGLEPNAKQFKVADHSSTPRSLSGVEAEQLLQHLKAGGELDIYYALTDGIQRRAILGQEEFAQSVAMFDACIAMSP